jgi:hypothetical protein
MVVRHGVAPEEVHESRETMRASGEEYSLLSNVALLKTRDFLDDSSFPLYVSSRNGRASSESTRDTHSNYSTNWVV